MSKNAAILTFLHMWRQFWPDQTMTFVKIVNLMACIQCSLSLSLASSVLEISEGQISAPRSYQIGPQTPVGAWLMFNKLVQELCDLRAFEESLNLTLTIYRLSWPVDPNARTDLISPYRTENGIARQ